MIGLVLSLFLGLIVVALGSRWQDAYRKSTALLFWWNMAFTVFLVAVWLSGTVFIASLSALFSGVLGFLVGLTGGGLALSALLFLMVVASVIQTLGALFLYNAIVVTSEGEYEWKRDTLVVGAIFTIIGLTRIIG